MQRQGYRIFKDCESLCLCRFLPMTIDKLTPGMSYVMHCMHSTTRQHAVALVISVDGQCKLTDLRKIYSFALADATKHISQAVDANSVHFFRVMSYGHVTNRTPEHVQLHFDGAWILHIVLFHVGT